MLDFPSSGLAKGGTTTPSCPPNEITPCTEVYGELPFWVLVCTPPPPPRSLVSPPCRFLILKSLATPLPRSKLMSHNKSGLLLVYQEFGFICFPYWFQLSSALCVFSYIEFFVSYGSSWQIFAHTSCADMPTSGNTNLYFEAHKPVFFNKNLYFLKTYTNRLPLPHFITPWGFMKSQLREYSSLKVCFLLFLDAITLINCIKYPGKICF